MYVIWFLLAFQQAVQKYDDFYVYYLVFMRLGNLEREE